MEKKQWSKPELEVLQVNMTELNKTGYTQLDHDYPTGTPFPKLTWS